jgi:hypothetical protein
MKTVNIQGKEYVEVSERIKEFRVLHPDGQILTEIISLENGVITMKATVRVNDKTVATGHAQEKEGSTFINKTSFVENCETSAIGRALGCFGVGLAGSVASADEVQNAIANQKPKKDLFPKGEDTLYVTELQMKDLLLLDDAKRLQDGYNALKELGGTYTKEQNARIKARKEELLKQGK